MNKVAQIGSLVVGSLTVVGIAFAFYSENQMHHQRPMQFTAAIRVFTAQSVLTLYDENAKQLASQPLKLPVTKRLHLEDRNATISFDRSHITVQDSLNHVVFQYPLIGAGQVIMDSGFHGTVQLPLSMSERYALGEGIKPTTPHSYTLLITPNYQSRFL